MVINSIGHFLPKVFVIKPKSTLPINPPNEFIDATHEACSIVIMPDGKGVSSDKSLGKFGDGHPHAIPYSNGRILTYI